MGTRLTKGTFGLLSVLLTGLLIAPGANATPVSIIDAGYWLENIGANTVNTTFGPRTIFFATTNPYTSDTSATANFSGTSTFGPFRDGGGWIRLASGPLGSLNLNPLTVQFSNGGDTASFTGRSLVGLDLLPLAFNLNVSGDPLSPLISWELPTGAGIDIDRIQLVFYRTDTNQEVGTRVNLSGTATSYDIIGQLFPGLTYTFNVRLIDQFDDSVVGNSDSNILRASRAYIDYLAVPEPGTLALLGLGLAGIGVIRRRRTH